MSITIDEVKRKIRNLDDISLKIITDLVTYQIHKSSYNKSSGENYIDAEDSVSEYLAENLNSFDELKETLTDSGDGMKGIESFANKIYDYYYRKPPDFNFIKRSISAKKDISLKAITDMVAYKISQSEDDKGPEINYITAETFVAQYISENFKDVKSFKLKLRKFGETIDGIRNFSDIIYNQFNTRRS